MPKASEMFSGSYVKAADLQGKKVLVTIESVDMEELGSGSDKESKWVARFEGREKRLVLNVTNANMIGEISGGKPSEEWGGLKIVLYPAKTDYQGKRVDCIRVDYPPKPQTQPTTRRTVPPTPPVEDDFEADASDVPFVAILAPYIAAAGLLGGLLA